MLRKRREVGERTFAIDDAVFYIAEHPSFVCFAFNCFVCYSSGMLSSDLSVCNKCLPQTVSRVVGIG
jgi:hypothetical protein